MAVKTCLDKTGVKITNELYKAVEELGGSPCLLAMIGSWADTLDDEEILSGLELFNRTGNCLLPGVPPRH